MVRSHFATPRPIKNGSKKLSGGVHNAQTTHANLSESVSVSVPGSVNAPLLVARKSHLSGCLMAFCPKILGGGGDLRIIVLLKNECSFSGGDM